MQKHGLRSRIIKVLPWFLAASFLGSARVLACTEGKQAYAFEDLSVSSSAVTLTSATYTTNAPATCAEVLVDNAEIRYRIDSGTPTTTSGHQKSSGDTIYISNDNRTTNINNAKFIRRTSTDAHVHVTYWR